MARRALCAAEEKMLPTLLAMLALALLAVPVAAAAETTLSDTSDLSAHPTNRSEDCVDVVPYPPYVIIREDC